MSNSRFENSRSREEDAAAVAGEFTCRIRTCHDSRMCDEISREFRDKYMFFQGGCVSPAATADITTADFFIRVVCERDLRPEAKAWTAWVVGIFRGYCHTHRLVFLEVDPVDYHVGDTQ